MKNGEKENLYVLKHKDMDVALVYVDTHTGRIEYLIELFLPEELPVGCRAEGNSLSNWWKMRAIPDSRKGILRVLKQLDEETAQHRLTAMAPVFDTGNSLFYNEEAVPSGKGLLDLNVTSFRKREAEMLQYVKTPEWFPVEKLAELPCAAEELLGNNTGMPPERVKKIARTIAEKTEYLKLFLSGKKIWKRERFW